MRVHADVWCHMLVSGGPWTVLRLLKASTCRQPLRIFLSWPSPDATAVRCVGRIVRLPRVRRAPPGTPLRMPVGHEYDADFDFDTKPAKMLELAMEPRTKSSTALKKPPAPLGPPAVDLDDWDDDDYVSPERPAPRSAHPREGDEDEGEDDEEDEEEEHLEQALPVSLDAVPSTPERAGQWACVNAGGVELEGEPFVCPTSAKETTTPGENGASEASGGDAPVFTAAQLRKAVADAVTQVEARARKQQERAVSRAIEAAAEQLRSELEAQAKELEDDFSQRLEVEAKARAAAPPPADRKAAPPPPVAPAPGIGMALTGEHASILDTIELRQQRSLTTFRACIRVISSASQQAHYVHALEELTEASRAVGKLCAELKSEPYVERIRIPSNLLTKPAAEQEAEPDAVEEPKAAAGEPEVQAEVAAVPEEAEADDDEFEL